MQNTGADPDPSVVRSRHSSFHRPAVTGRFLSNSGERLWIRGVTYGTFRPRPDGDDYPDPATAESDFRRIAANGLNSIRTYTVPPPWLLDLAYEYRLRVMVGIPWEQHVAFLEDKTCAARIEERVRAGVRACAGHPTVLCYAVGNEIPASIVRWHGPLAVERHIERLYNAAKEEEPDGLVTYVNYPTTEYLDLPFLDLVCFNVYLESPNRLKEYLGRLHNLAGDRPLILAEVGLDSGRHGELNQALLLDAQIRNAFASGCAGAFVFGWTDEWYRGGHEIKDWDFGLTRRDRKPKAALGSVRRAFSEVPFVPDPSRPRVSVVVCTYNGARTLRDCLEGLSRLEYPNYEVILIDDGSTDSTPVIAAEYNCRIIRTDNHGLASARNLGLKEATGEIIAYIDDDAWPDPAWLSFIVDRFQETDHAGIGGPNLPPPGDGFIADCVANAPGGPAHVLLSDQVAEHIPGCNMAFRKSCLDAIGGFDAQFRAAGDDVDICWSLQERGWTLGFHPAAVVWHHRRGSIRAYWRQQKGYGNAEAQLERKWPDKFRPSGNLAWRGRIYCKAFERALVVRPRIYHGTWGSAPFQSLYSPASGPWLSLLLMPEWYLVILGLVLLSGLGLLWRPLLLAAPILVSALGVSLVQAARGVARVPFRTGHRSRLRRLGQRGLTVALSLLQPLARLSGRLRSGLTPWRFHVRLTPSLPRPRRYRFWSERWREPGTILQELEGVLRDQGALVSRGGDSDRWDLQIRTGLFGGGRLLMGIEEHGAGKQLLRFRIWPWCSAAGLAVSMTLAALATAAARGGAWPVAALLGIMALWPLARTILECGVAVSASVRGFKRLWPAGGF